MTQFIDRRTNSLKKSTVNRQRFIRRYKNQIKQAVAQAIGKRSITEINQGENVHIPSKDISEPQFSSGKGGRIERILPGNDQFFRGDTLEKPPESKTGSGDGAGNQGEGEDDFIFSLSREEFLDLYFEDLELPDLVKKELATLTTTKSVRAGIKSSGIPSNINVGRSMRQAIGRRIGLSSPYKKKLEAIEQALAQQSSETASDTEAFEKLTAERAYLQKKIGAIPFIDTLDLRYNNRVQIPAPTTQAVMFCIMDVSGSMDEPKKEMAKQFFTLLYLFLTKNYKKIELVFIRHHTSAKIVNEQDFFYSRETGGTVVSSALELLASTIGESYPPNIWNIYVAQASDGDNWNADSPYCQELLFEKIMPVSQYYAYVEITPRHHQSLWEMYAAVAERYKNFAMQNIDTASQIYPVFRALFKRKKL